MDAPTCLAPDPDPSEPAWRPPPLACDAHCHVLGPPARYPYAPDRRYTPYEAPPERLAALHALLGLQRAVLVNASCHGHDNRVVTDAIAAHAADWRGVASIDERLTERDLQMLHAGGIRAVRFMLLKGSGSARDPAQLQRIVTRVRPFDWHVELSVEAADLAELMPLIEPLAVTFVIDHMGRIPTDQGIDQPAFRLMLAIARGNERCWVKLSGIERVSRAGPPFTDALPFAQALIAAAPERVVWGSGWPHPNLSRHMPDDGELLDLIPLMTPDPLMQRRLLVDNPARLYGWDASSTTALDGDGGA